MRPTARPYHHLLEGEKPMPHRDTSLAITRRSLGIGAASLAGAAAFGLAPARAQAAPCIVGTWGGDYQNLLEANIAKPLLEPKGVTVQWDVAAQGPRKN